MTQIQKRNNRRYFHYQKEILNTISEPASFITNKYRYVFVNNAFNDFFNKQTDKVIGKTPSEIWGDDNFKKNIAPQMDRALNGETVFFQYRGKMLDGKFKILEINYYPHYKPSGSIDGIIAITNDVTKQKYAEEALKESEARLKDLNETKDKLFSVIGHDLKGPLHNIVAFSELIEEQHGEYSREEIRKFNQLILQSAQSLSSLLDNLLSWSYSQTQSIKIFPQAILLHSIAEKCFDFLKQNAFQKEIRLVNDVSPEMQAVADEKMITTVIRNLISNAIKFTDRGGKIIVTATIVEDEIFVAIRDSGMGISKEKKELLFQSCGIQSSTGTEGEGGTGMGLIICKDFIEKNNGRIWVESELNNGSVFSFSLPVNF
ncbi:PAS domain-containing sensor histidine kinase [Maribellus maritimus]|uniref:PAS domain-containing sensor histidine kinase n=1 Tax=Maribellus maritimus TaxID=2870838 RepID=UPI001EECDDC3|nr:PAS domain-containing sensor histidine kinase [Maribellus maritimus]MCG6190256.1 PAS domain-containing sensor histidine kinase [Maribellus maritimus]